LPEIALLFACYYPKKVWLELLATSHILSFAGISSAAVAKAGVEQPSRSLHKDYEQAIRK
jgi:hypothetical protein